MADPGQSGQGAGMMQDAQDIRALRRQMVAELTVSGIQTPELDGRVLLAHVLGCAPGEIILHDESPVEPDVFSQAMALLVRRISGEPVARILGHREFWSLDFNLSPDTLVPRPDTETVVELALEAFPDREAPLRILDLGTGSGAILAALLVERPRATGIGVDLAEGAARMARHNLGLAGVADRVALVVGSWAQCLTGGFDLVVSNPPYIQRSDLPVLPWEVRAYDPELALDGGDDGLDAYRAISADLPRLLKPGAVAVLELGIGQEEDVADLLEQAGLQVCRPARADLSGIARAIRADRPRQGPPAMTK